MMDFINPKGLGRRIGRAFRFDRSDASLYAGALGGFWAGKGLQMGVDWLLKKLPGGMQQVLDKGGNRVQVRGVVTAVLALVAARAVTSGMKRGNFRVGLGAGAGIAALHSVVSPFLPAALQGWGAGGGRAVARPAAVQGSYMDEKRLGAAFPTHKARVSMQGFSRRNDDPRYGRAAAISTMAAAG